LWPLSTAGTLFLPAFSGTVNPGSLFPECEILDSNGNPIGDLSSSPCRLRDKAVSRCVRRWPQGAAPDLESFN